MNDPLYEVYDSLRAQSPVLWNPDGDCWMVFDHAGVLAALRNPALSSGARTVAMRREFAARLGDQAADGAVGVFERQLETRDPPGHTPVRQAFSRGLHAMAPALREAVPAALAGLEAAHGWRLPLDWIAAVAQPLPLWTVLELIGVAPAARAALAADVEAFLQHLSDPAVDGAAALARLRAALAACDAGLVRWLRQHEPALAEDDLVANTILLVSAGHRTTANLLASMVHTLLGQPEVLTQLQAAPGRVRAAVEECLRLESPVQALQRTALEDTVLGGCTVRAGQQVLLMVGAANRDPSVFSQPARVDLHRRQGPVLALGHGTHFCLGAAVARLQAELVLQASLPALAGLRVAEAAWRDDTRSRALQRLVLARATPLPRRSRRPAARG